MEQEWTAPEVGRVAIARLAPGDVIVVECDAYLTTDITRRIQEGIARVWPANQVVVLDKGVHLKVVKADDEGR